MTRTGIFVASAGVLFLGHAGAILWLGTHALGPIISDLIQLVLGCLVLLACLSAAERSTALPKYFWRLTACSFGFWLVAQALSMWGDIVTLSTAAQWSINVLFSFWFVPMAMTLFLDQDREVTGLDAYLVMDFVQAVLFCLAAYFYFFFLPRSESSMDLAHSVWQPYFVGYGALAGAFVMRSFSASLPHARLLFRRMGLFLVLSGAVDAFYYYGPGQQLKTGSWFDLLWSALLWVPLITAAGWRQTEIGEPIPVNEVQARRRTIATQLFALVFPLLTLIMALGIARQRLAMAAAVILAAFVTSSARLLLIHHQLLQTQEALHHEALHDSLTGLLNRKAILDVLDKELQRSQRTGSPLGIVLADIDHFKRVNDTHGHAAGDLVLRIVGSEIAAALRPYDALGRCGGEEFLIVTSGCDFNQTWALAERVRLSVANCSVSIGGEQLAVTLSLGVAAGYDLASEALLHVADEALYKAKSAGRNRTEPQSQMSSPEPPESIPALRRNFWL